MIEVKADEFRRYIAAKTCLVLFGAPWCAPCGVLTKSLVALGDALPILKVNVDDEPALAVHYQIRNVPTLILFSGGDVASVRSGAVSVAQVRNWLRDEGVL